MFSNEWQNYIRTWFSRCINFDFEDLIPMNKILLWGIVPYKQYRLSDFFLYHPIQLNNHELNIYFYVRVLESSDLYLYFFANTTEFKSRILASDSENIDNLFLKRLYQNSISFYRLFNHCYSENCWSTLNEQKHLFIE